jgi:hypothetical protein
MPNEIFLPVYEINGYGRDIRDHVSVTFAKNRGTISISQQVVTKNGDCAFTDDVMLLTRNECDGLTRKSLSQANRDEKDAFGGAAFSIKGDPEPIHGLKSHLHNRNWFNSFNVHYMPSGVLLTAAGIYGALKSLRAGFREGDSEMISTQVARGVFGIFEGPEMSQHQRICLYEEASEAIKSIVEFDFAAQIAFRTMINQPIDPELSNLEKLVRETVFIPKF